MSYMTVATSRPRVQTQLLFLRGGAAAQLETAAAAAAAAALQFAAASTTSFELKRPTAALFLNYKRGARLLIRAAASQTL